jgi:hypothetical protein
MKQGADFYWLVLGVLAVWRVAHLFHAEDGPWDLFARLRRLAGSSLFGRLLDCFYCLSLWVSLPVAWLIGSTWLERALLWPALSAGAIVLERLTGPRAATPAAIYYEDPAEGDPDVLRKEEGGGERRGASSSGA